MDREPIKVRVVIEDAGKNYGAYSPDLSGCVATGNTREEIEANMREAIVFHLEGLADERGLSADSGAKQALREAAALIERGEGLSFEEAVGEEQNLNDAPTSEDRAWIKSDLSRLGEIEPYKWQEGELDDGIPVSYEPGVSWRIKGTAEGTQ